MPDNIFSIPYEIVKEPVLKATLAASGFSFSEINHAFWQAKKEGMNVTFYRSGKLLLQGRGADAFAKEILSENVNIYGLDHLPDVNTWIGTDEAGKGDYFGPLVVAAVFMQKSQLKDFMLLQIQDSKGMSDKKIRAVAAVIKRNCDYAVEVFPPESYNDRYAEFRNLNRLLAYGHAQVIENLLKRVQCDVVLSDKFADDSLISEALQERGLHVNLIQRTQAEGNPAVAAASILAREAFLHHLEKMDERYRMAFPRGGSKDVIKTAQLFIDAYGKDRLKLVAKLHFKTTEKFHG